MLCEEATALIRAEQARQGGRFIADVDLEAYLAKLGDRAELVQASAQGRCRGLVAFYCNDHTTRQAYITLVLVDPQDRGLGIGRALVAGALDLARGRGFTSCRLEVARDNVPAHALYRSLGFQVIEGRTAKDLMEIAF